MKKYLTILFAILSGCVSQDPATTRVVYDDDTAEIDTETPWADTDSSYTVTADDSSGDLGSDSLDSGGFLDTMEYDDTAVGSDDTVPPVDTATSHGTGTDTETAATDLPPEDTGTDTLWDSETGSSGSQVDSDTSVQPVDTDSATADVPGDTDTGTGSDYVTDCVGAANGSHCLDDSTLITCWDEVQVGITDCTVAASPYAWCDTGSCEEPEPECEEGTYMCDPDVAAWYYKCEYGAWAQYSCTNQCTLDPVGPTDYDPDGDGIGWGYGCI